MSSCLLTTLQVTSLNNMSELEERRTTYTSLDLKEEVKDEIRQVMKTVGDGFRTRIALESLRHVNNLTNDEWTHPLFWKLLMVPAEEKTQRRLLNICISHGVDFNQITRFGGKNVFHYSIDQFDFRFSGREKWTLAKLQCLFKMLKEAGADSCQEDNQGDDTLKYALRKSAPLSFISFLLEDICGPKIINRRNKTGITPLHLAAKSCSKEVTELLISKGADIFAQDNNGNNFIHYVLLKYPSITEDQKSIIKEFAPQLKDQRNKKNMTPLAVLLIKNLGYIYHVPHEEVFDSLIPSSEVINEQYVLDETGQSVSCLRRVVSMTSSGKGLERIKKLVDAGAIITPDVICEGILFPLQKIQYHYKEGSSGILGLLFQLGGTSQVSHLKNCLERDDGISLLIQVLYHIPDGDKVVKEEFPDILLQCLSAERRKHKSLSSMEDLFSYLFALLVDNFGIDINFTTTKDGVVSDALREVIKQGPILLNVLFELKAIPKLYHIKDCLDLEDENGIPVLKEVLNYVPDGRNVVKEHFPDILLQCLRKHSLQDFDPSLLTLLVNEYGIDINYSTTEDGLVLDALREVILRGPHLLYFMCQLKAIPKVYHLKCCLQLRHEDEDGIPVLKEVIKHIPDGKNIVKREYPEILLQCLRYMKISNRIDLSFVSVLLDEYGIDVNFIWSREGSLLHWLASLRYDEEERTSLLIYLIEKHGIALNLDILTPHANSWVTPLQLAVENNSFRFANILIRNFASIKKLSLPQRIASFEGTEIAALHAMLQMLQYLGVADKQLVVLMSLIKSRYKTFRELQDPRISFPSLLQFAAQYFRRITTRQQAMSLIQDIDLGSRVRDFLYLNNIQELEFPEEPDQIPDSADEYEDDHDYEMQDNFDDSD